MKLTHSTAVLYFSRSASAEVEHKKWNVLQSKRQNLQVAKHLVDSTLEGLHRTGLPVFHYDQEMQIGSSFGYRLANSVKDLFDRGFTSVITVGNDCIDLENLPWTQLANQLQNNYSVIGPALQHGAYLVGLHKSQFDYQRFAELPWNTNRLQRELVEYLDDLSSGRIIELEVKADFNSNADIKSLFRLLSTERVFQLLGSILAVLGLCILELVARSKAYSEDYQFSVLSLRGPPLC